MMNDAELIEAFHKTNYVILSDKFNKGRCVLNIGKSHCKLAEVSSELKTWAFITAWNPLPLVLSSEENIKRNALLVSDIESANYEYLFGYGESLDQSWREESFFIQNISKDDARGLGEKYGQKAIVFGLARGMAELVLLT